jgi:hypothetical protein
MTKEGCCVNYGGRVCGALMSIFNQKRSRKAIEPLRGLKSKPQNLKLPQRAGFFLTKTIFLTIFDLLSKRRTDRAVDPYDKIIMKGDKTKCQN